MFCICRKHKKHCKNSANNKEKIMNKSMNILWICTDQQRFDSLGCYGNKFVKTPNLDKLASSGVRFTNAYAQSPVCAPSRASFLTGRYPRTCRVRQNGQDIPAEERLLPKVLSENGYTCGLSGKLHISAVHPRTKRKSEPRIDDGYDAFYWSHHPAANKSEDWPSNEYSIWLREQGVTYNPVSIPECRYVQTGISEKYHQTTWCVDRAMHYIESAKENDAPWMFSLNIFDPHHRFDPPSEYFERYLTILDDIPLPNYKEGELNTKPSFQQVDHEGSYSQKGNCAFIDMTEKDHKYLRAAYWAMVDLIDKQVGRLFDYLEQTNQLENTMIIFMSDHGESLGDHGMYLKGPYFYENNIRVPLLISCPGTIQSGIVSNALVELVDLVPTILDLTCIKPEPGVQGQTLLPILQGQKNEHRKSVYSEFYCANVGHRDPKAYETMICDGQYKLVRVHSKGELVACEGELYDLKTDPTETHNQYTNPAYANIKTKLLETLVDRMAETADPLPVRQAEW